MDVTFRDAGYLNNWGWDEDVMFKGVELLKPVVDLIEVGYIRPKIGFKQASLKEPLMEFRDSLCLMIDLKDYIVDDIVDCHTMINDIKKNNFARVIRIATTEENIAHARYAAYTISALGNIRVFVSIMKCSLISSGDLKKTLDMFESEDWRDSINCLYFADSFGSLTATKGCWSERMPIGFHSHNNQGQSFQLYKNSNVDYFDSSLHGLGRGAGNCDTLQILLDRGFLTQEIYDYANKYIKPLKPRNQPLLAYQYSGMNNIHPNHVSYWHKAGKTEFEIIKILENLNNKYNLTVFNKDTYKDLNNEQ
jgi:hypothetical protein